MATYAIGDTHGCLLTLKYLIEDVLGVSKSDEVVFLGDYIDRGPSSAQLVDYLIRLKDSGYKLTLVRGNHEQMLLDAARDWFNYDKWVGNTGDLTLNSYRNLLGKSFHFPYDIPENHMVFYKGLPLVIETSNFLFVHGGINHTLSQPLRDTETLLWGRPEAIPSGFMGGKTIIHGHTPHPIDKIIEVVESQNPKLIPLDAGCVYAGRSPGLGNLAALRLDDMKLFWVEKKD